MHHHGRFYAALILGAAAYALAWALGCPVPSAVGADTFFAVFLAVGFWLIVTLTSSDLERKADIADDGAFLVTLIALGAIVYASYAIFTILNPKQAAPPSVLWLTMAGAPLSWFMLHMVMVFHYANLHYRDDDRKDYVEPLKFPECGQPGPWDFLYFSMTVGMTAQVSDTVVQTTAMRRAVMLHAAVSFFVNTVLIAMAVNAAVTLAG